MDATTAGRIAVSGFKRSSRRFTWVGSLNGLRAELKNENILVSTACPGLMQTGCSRNGSFQGLHPEEYAWLSIGDSLPLMSMSVEEAASQILDACQQGRGEFLVANPFNVAVHLQRYFPALTNEISALMDQQLPDMGGIGKEAVRDYESESSENDGYCVRQLCGATQCGHMYNKDT